MMGAKLNQVYKDYWYTKINFKKTQFLGSFFLLMIFIDMKEINNYESISAFKSNLLMRQHMLFWLNKLNKS
jgi:hypothetical protein